MATHKWLHPDLPAIVRNLEAMDHKNRESTTELLARSFVKPPIPYCLDWEPPGLPEIAGPSFDEQLVDLLKPKQPEKETRGRKRTYNWDQAISAAWAEIYRGDTPSPKILAEVEAILADQFPGDKLPAPSLIRQKARIIWADLQKE